MAITKTLSSRTSGLRVVKKRGNYSSTDQAGERQARRLSLMARNRKAGKQRANNDDTGSGLAVSRAYGFWRLDR
ncbi:uncharacterized protein GLRG_11850 [Colletotrichum graminicola M1.001]|uniref:Uncharacterized protein n=1 Tax=Colletotrichum graminicola (strain M1.001 / M2 / FGSC 10212) TaxID=645133 RepID=E3R0R3_COLGM|nr:uncharacterized protein GLRG_11850 [Colletotrichum graminicola M1.001]EFQ36701.1 hypothetical protein GLRG_11850 [Colletotrichum graminicola M1.001]